MLEYTRVQATHKQTVGVDVRQTIQLGSASSGRNVWVDSDPGTREYSCKAAPNNVPNGPTMGKVGTTS